MNATTGAALLAVLPALAAAAAPAAWPAAGMWQMPAAVATHADGRPPVGELYARFAGLVDSGWTLEVIHQSQPPGTDRPLPIIALRSPVAGPALWILAGIHGEEPAGPAAVAAVTRELARVGRRRALVLLPLLNPHGYARNWRYLNMPLYDANATGASVGDSSHWLPEPEAPSQPRAPAATSAEAGAVTRYVLARSADYPPACSIDLHEDNLIDAGYVYSQGSSGAADPLASAAVAVLRRQGVPIQPGGRTRFDEPIAGGIVGPVTDSSIDELISAATVLVGGQPRPGPAAATVLVVETPAAALPLARRVAAQAAVLRALLRPPHRSRKAPSACGELR